jgi:hypothetical protein
MKGAVFWDIMLCILKMEAAGCSKILLICLLPSTRHFSDDCIFYKSVSEVLEGLSHHFTIDIF